MILPGGVRFGGVIRDGWLEDLRCHLETARLGKECGSLRECPPHHPTSKLAGTRLMDDETVAKMAPGFVRALIAGWGRGRGGVAGELGDDFDAGAGSDAGGSGT
jgi:hypothetical protein